MACFTSGMAATLSGPGAEILRLVLRGALGS